MAKFLTLQRVKYNGHNVLANAEIIIDDDNISAELLEAGAIKKAPAIEAEPEAPIAKKAVTKKTAKEKAAKTPAKEKEKEA